MRPLEFRMLACATVGTAEESPFPPASVARLSKNATGKKSAVLVARSMQYLTVRVRPDAEKRDVEHAVRLIEDAKKTPEEFLHDVARKTGMSKRLHELPSASRLALEMASHEEAERRAMEGELALLEAAWRQAEEIAKSADNLRLPSTVDEFVERHRGKP